MARMLYQAVQGPVRAPPPPATPTTVGWLLGFSDPGQQKRNLNLDIVGFFAPNAATPAVTTGPLGWFSLFTEQPSKRGIIRPFEDSAVVLTAQPPATTGPQGWFAPFADPAPPRRMLPQFDSGILKPIAAAPVGISGIAWFTQLSEPSSIGKKISLKGGSASAGAITMPNFGWFATWQEPFRPRPVTPFVELWVSTAIAVIPYTTGPLAWLTAWPGPPRTPPPTPLTDSHVNAVATVAVTTGPLGWFNDLSFVYKTKPNQGFYEIDTFGQLVPRNVRDPQAEDKTTWVPGFQTAVFR